jgi:pyrroloquinoline quinone biosynthesis protein D
MSANKPGSHSPERLIISAASRPALAHHVRLRFDENRQRWIMLAPERLLTPSDTAVAVLRLCNADRSVATIAAALATEYAAAEDTILADIVPLLQDLADKGYVTATRS